MVFDKCISCGAISPESQYCPACGRAKKKWCPRCGKWQSAWYATMEMDDMNDPQAAIAAYQAEAKFCPECGWEMQEKAAPHE